MKNYCALVNNNVVTDIIVADFDWVKNNLQGDWHDLGPEPLTVAIGWTYDNDVDVFVAPQPYPSWTLDENNDWQPPIPMPADDKEYRWSEEDLEWVAI